MTRVSFLTMVLASAAIVAGGVWLATRHHRPVTGNPPLHVSAPGSHASEGAHTAQTEEPTSISVPPLSVGGQNLPSVKVGKSLQTPTREMIVAIKNATDRNDEAQIKALINTLFQNQKDHIFSIISIAEDATISPRIRATMLSFMGTMRDADSLHSLVSLSMSLPEHELRAQTIKSLGVRPEHEAEHRLQKLSSDPSDPAQVMAVSFLGNGADLQSRRILNRHVQSPTTSDEIKNAALYALRQYKDDDTNAALVTTAKDVTASARLRATAIYSLGVIGNREALPVVKDNLNSQDREIRYSAVLAATRVSDEEVSKLLVRSLCDTSNYPHVRKAASSALARNATAADLEVLRSEVSHTDGFGIRLASEVFAEKKDLSAVPVLKSLVQTISDTYVTDGVEKAIKTIETKK